MVYWKTKHQHLIEVARALAFYQIFREESIQCATYLINRLPLASIGHLSPYKKLYGTKPNNQHSFASIIK